VYYIYNNLILIIIICIMHIEYIILLYIQTMIIAVLIMLYQLHTAKRFPNS